MGNAKKPLKGELIFDYLDIHKMPKIMTPSDEEMAEILKQQAAITKIDSLITWINQKISEQKGGFGEDTLVIRLRDATLMKHQIKVKLENYILSINRKESTLIDKTIAKRSRSTPSK